MNPDPSCEITCLVGGAPLGGHDVDLIQQLPYRLVGVDGGANNLTQGRTPALILGDLDSLENAQAWAQKTQVLHLGDQDTTDLEKAAAYEDANRFLCFGFVGGRFDQTLTVLHTVTRFPHKHFLFVSDHDLILSLGRAERTYNFEVEPSTRFSLYPLTPCDFGRSEGLLYPLEGLHMAQGGLIGTSNQTLGASVTLKLLSGQCLAILPKADNQEALVAQIQNLLTA